MLTPQEEQFLKYWSQKRLHLSGFWNKVKFSLPFALLFSLPILGLMAAVFLFLPDWAAKVDVISPGTMVTVVIATLAITIFVAYFRSHFLWETNEQAYKELENKRI